MIGAHLVALSAGEQIAFDGSHTACSACGTGDGHKIKVVSTATVHSHLE